MSMITCNNNDKSHVQMSTCQIPHFQHVRDLSHIPIDILSFSKCTCHLKQLTWEIITCHVKLFSNQRITCQIMFTCQHIYYMSRETVHRSIFLTCCMKPLINSLKHFYVSLCTFNHNTFKFLCRCETPHNMRQRHETHENT